MGDKKNKPNNEQENQQLMQEQNEEQQVDGQNEQDLEIKKEEGQKKPDKDSGYTEPTPEKKDKPFKYPVVSRWNCFKIIFYCLIVACTLFVPIVLDPLKFAFQGVPLISDGHIAKLQVDFALGFSSLIGLENVLAQPLSMIMEYCTLVFYGILALDIFFSLVLCVLPYNGVRIVFRIFSIIFGIAMLLLAFLYLSSFVGFFGYLFMQAGDMNGLVNNLGTQFLSSGILFFIACTVFAFTLIKRQFKWFAKRPY